MKNNNENKLLEGFWDTVITKAKQGALAVAGAAGSSTAKGKLSASLLSDAIYSQYKEWNASTGTDVSSVELGNFLQGIGFSPEFSKQEGAELGKILSSGTPPATPGTPPATPGTTPGTTPATPATPATPGTTNQQKIQAQKDINARMKAKRGPRPTRESLDEAVISDSELRKFFDTLAKRALKNGEAKTAAKKTIGISRTSSDTPNPDESPAGTPPATPGTSPAPAPATPATPGTSPATPPATPPATRSPIPKYSDREKAIMDAFPAGTKLGPQIKATSPELQSLAQKVMQSAFDQYKQYRADGGADTSNDTTPAPTPTPSNKNRQNNKRRRPT